MRFTVETNELIDTLKVVSKAVATKFDTPILSGIFIKAEKSILEFQATNHSVGIIAKIPALVEQDGEIVVAGKKIFEIVKKLSGEVVTVSLENSIAKIISESAIFGLPIFKPEDFPKFQLANPEKTILLLQKQLKNILKHTTFAAGDTTGNMLYTGVLFTVQNETLTAVATNTHRLAVYREELNQKISDDKLEFIVPAKPLAEICRLLDDNGEVKISQLSNKIAITFDNFSFVLRHIEGFFPAYEKVFPKQSTTLATFDTHKLLNALNRVSVIADDIIGGRTDFLFDDNQIKISSISGDNFRVTETVPAKINGNELDISFNFEYLIDVLQILDTEKCTIGLTEPLKPALLQSENFRYVVTPIRRT